MNGRSTIARAGLLLSAWILAVVSVPVYIHFDHAGWDLQAYRDAAAVLRRGGDPYSAGIQREKEFDSSSHGTTAERPLPYLYPPVTLPLLRLLHYPPWMYWVIYVAGVGAILSVGVQLATPPERTVVAVAAAAGIYFPALLQLDCVLGGNVSFIAYGALLATALRGWRKHRWTLFYCTVLLTSLVKAPWLSLLAIPAFSSKREWPRVTIVGAVGLATFAGQQWIWPREFESWREALRLEFVYNGFGLSPAGIVAQLRFERGLSYGKLSAATYVLTAVVVLGCLWKVSTLYRSGMISLERSGPVLLSGVFLLQPRLKDYDASALTISMGLILWRLLKGPLVVRIAAWCGVVATINLIAANSWPSPGWNRCACLLLSFCFLAGCRDCFREAPSLSTSPPSSPESCSNLPAQMDSAARSYSRGCSKSPPSDPDRR